MTVAYEIDPLPLASDLFAIQLDAFSLSICSAVVIRAVP